MAHIFTRIHFLPPVSPSAFSLIKSPMYFDKEVPTGYFILWPERMVWYYNNYVLVNTDIYEKINHKIVCVCNICPNTETLWKELGDLKNPDIDLVNAYIGTINYLTNNKHINFGYGLFAQMENLW